MTHYFFDSSALIKRYIPETGTNWIRSITPLSSLNTTIIARITQIEIRSGIMRRHREGNLTARTSKAVRLALHRHITREYMVIELDDVIVQRAEDLLEAHPLRAYDATQLASGLEANHRLLSAGLSPLIFVSADNRLLVAAQTEGLITDDPNLHP